MKTNFYIDGFNLYYRAVKGTPYKWLDLAQVCRALAPSHQVNHIRYFTALVQPRPGNLQAPRRQLIYIRALETIQAFLGITDSSGRGGYAVLWLRPFLGSRVW